MNLTPFVRAAVLCSLLVFTPSLFAQQKKAAPVEVMDVKFDDVNIAGYVAKMNRMEVRIRALNNAKLLEDPKTVVPNKDWVDRIKVTVSTVYEAPTAPNAKGEKQYFCYRASSTIMTMKRNTTGSVYFYLPGEIVERDRLKKEPYAYLVDIEVDGTALPPNEKLVSKNIKTKDALDKLREIADRGASDNAGVLRTQSQLSFAPGQGTTPTLVREDSTRL